MKEYPPGPMTSTLAGWEMGEVKLDEALIEEFTELGEIDDPAERYASASEDAQAVMDACTR